MIKIQCTPCSTKKPETDTNSGKILKMQNNPNQTLKDIIK